ncbi:type VI secretion system tube protein TssD [Kluyvera intermedia]|jgi:type VI secretion system Hcp family effector|uniref:type VI secretion system tube protein TssD n=1 Tax=Kluyvera intermedia TaxID=61648 RepID=UPI0024305B1A|nr:type VI secretion system tube protein TssD [Kluyvera intermedia]WEJ83374.1 MAG: type VI secretion system tube protein TssD [Kluyvera intermedia]
MSDIIYLRVTGETQGNISAGCGTYASVGNRWQHGHEDEIFSFSLTHALRGTGKGINLEGLRFQKLIDKSTPLFINAITNNERLFIEIDFWRINRTGRWERYYYIELRNASVIDIHTRITLNDLPTEDISVAYDYIQYKHLIANTAFDYLAFHAEYNHLFIPRRAQAPAPPKPAPVKPPSPPAPKVTPVYAKSCLKEKGCTDAGSAEEPAKNFGQMAIFTQPIVDDCCGYAHPDEATVATLTLGTLTQISGEWSLSGALGAARAIPWIGALASALYVPSAGKGSDRVPGRDEFWYEEELRKKALAGGTATTRVRFFWGTDIHGKPQVFGVHTGEGTPYENVRVANMQWNADTQRYEFTPAHGVDGPLITWTPGKPQNGDVPAHTGNLVPPIDQPTILVNPIPDGQSEYTTPPLQMPDDADFNDYILVFPADSGVQPIYIYLKSARDEPGMATGKGEILSDNARWLETASSGLGAPISSQVADKLRGRTFRNFGHFREEFWLAVSECPELLRQFTKSNQTIIKSKGAPFVIEEQAIGGRELFELHHIEQIQYDGPVYDIDNLRINTPRNHIRIHKEKK